jgi:hypothetical protein
MGAFVATKQRILGYALVVSSFESALKKLFDFKGIGSIGGE